MKTKRSFYFFCLLLTMGTASAVFTSCSEDDPGPAPFPEMVSVAGGTTTLNGTSVTLSGFQIGKYEVTQKQWLNVMGSWPDADYYSSNSYGVGDNYPVYGASHDDIQTFLTKLNQQTGKNYRLPTEAEWEYAAKGGQSTHNYNFSGSNTIVDVAWYNGNSDGKTHPVGTKAPNELGIYDMSGNVWEWCSDWFNGSTYPSGTTNPTGAVSGSYRVVRGGGWGGDARESYVSDRFRLAPDTRDGGFRLVLPLTTEATLLVDKTSIVATAAAAIDSIAVMSNVEWSATVSTDATWCTISPASGTGNGTITVNVAENTTTGSRSAKITVISGSLTLQVTVTQADPAAPFSEMVTVAGGTTSLGYVSEDAKQVTLSSFQIGKYEVTQAQWKLIMGSNPSIFKGDNLPVEMVSHDDIQGFLTALNTLTGKNYRLPTETEWEYAAKGGQSTHNYNFSGSNTIVDVAWYHYNSDGKTHPVGTKAPNELGIYDMSGNVEEWCSDWYGNTYPSSTTNPTGAVSGSLRVYRGGSWIDDARYCHVSLRGNGSPSNRSNRMGFRLVLPL